MYLMNFPTRTARLRGDSADAADFLPPDAVNAAGDSSPVDSGGGRYLRFLRGWGLKKNPLDPLAPQCPPRRTPGEGDTSDFYAGWGHQKTHWTHWTPQCPPPAPPGPRPGPRGPQAGPLRPPRPRGSTTPMPPCRGPQAATLCPGGSPALSR